MKTLGSSSGGAGGSPKVSHDDILTLEFSGGSGHSVGPLSADSSRKTGTCGREVDIGDSIFPSSLLSQRVFVWDLDETIIIFHSLLTGTFASRYGKVRILLCLSL